MPNGWEIGVYAIENINIIKIEKVSENMGHWPNKGVNQESVDPSEREHKIMKTGTVWTRIFKIVDVSKMGGPI